MMTARFLAAIPLAVSPAFAIADERLCLSVARSVDITGEGTRIDWQGSFKCAAAESMTDETATGAMTGVYRAGLDALVARYGQ